MTTSTIKGYELQATNTNSGQWGNVLNAQVIQYIDQNMGGVTNVTLSSSNVVLSASDSRNAIIRLTGSLLANVTVTIDNLTASPSQYGGGFYFVENLTTGNFTVSIRNTNVATAASIPQGTRATIISDAVNGVRIASASGEFQSGVSTLFFNATAPLGWTKSTTHDNKALRIVSSSGGGTGGSTAFTSVFAARTITQANLPNVTLTSNTTGAHVHPLTFNASGSDNPGGGNNYFCTDGTNKDGPYSPPDELSMSSAGDHFHTVPLGGSGTALDFAVQYVDAIICTKN